MTLRYSKLALSMLSILCVLQILRGLRYVTNADSSSSSSEGWSPPTSLEAPSNETFLPRRCTWNETMKECYELLSQHVFGDDNVYHHHRPSLESKWITKWYFLGDSTMHRLLAAWLAHHLPHIRTLAKMLRSRHRYYSVKTSSYVPPQGFEGPFHRHIAPYSMESTSFKNIWVDINATTTANASIQAEWLGVEYALDVELPSEHGRTTQETTAWYVRKQEHQKTLPGRTACVVATGHHDLNFRNLSALEYAHYVQDYLELMTASCRTAHESNPSIHPPPLLVWINLSAVKGYRAFPQQNDRIRAFNQAVEDILPHQWIYLDVYPRSCFSKHIDNIHLDQETYYWPLANLFWSIAVGGRFQDATPQGPHVLQVKQVISFGE